MEVLLTNQYKELTHFYEREIQNNYFIAEDMYKPTLKDKFENLKIIKSRFDHFTELYDKLKKEDKLSFIKKEREEIKKLTKLKIEFINIDLLDKVDAKVFDSGIKTDFFKIYYQITNDYVYQYCRSSWRG
jgi:hypothetical protein